MDQGPLGSKGEIQTDLLPIIGSPRQQMRTDGRRAGPVLRGIIQAGQDAIANRRYRPPHPVGRLKQALRNDGVSDALHKFVCHARSSPTSAGHFGSTHWRTRQSNLPPPSSPRATQKANRRAGDSFTATSHGTPLLTRYSVSRTTGCRLSFLRRPASRHPARAAAASRRAPWHPPPWPRQPPRETATPSPP